MKYTKIVIAIAAVALLSAGCGAAKTDNTNNSSNDAAMNSNSSATTDLVAANSVEISDFKFSPTTITVKKGTTITWTNKDDARHNVVAQGANASTGPKSELMGNGESYNFTFNAVGEYNYLCEPHPYMTGKVIVTE